MYVISYLVRQALNRRHRFTRRKRFAALLGSAMGLTMGLGQASVMAEEIAAASSLGQIRERLLDLDQVQLNRNPRQEIDRKLAITQDEISETSLTPPSLWWSRDIITAALRSLRSAPQWIEAWIAYLGSEAQPRRVDVVVNPQIWNQLNYLERYAVLNQFGYVAKSYGYSTRFFRGLDLTAAYICDFSQHPELETETAATLSQARLAEIDCMIDLDFRGRGSIRGAPTPGGGS